jgi:cytidylate kinase
MNYRSSLFNWVGVFVSASMVTCVANAQNTVMPSPMPSPMPPVSVQASVNEVPQLPPSVPVAGTLPNSNTSTAQESGQSKRAMLMSALNGITVPDSNVPFTPSYGDITTSILLSDEDAELMRTALDRVERVLASGKEINRPNTGGVAERPDVQTPEGTPAPPADLEFHTYHVASILYRSPSDWMVWLNGERVTPKRNHGKARVVRVTPDTVTLAWEASDWENRMQVWSDDEPLSAELKKIQARSAITRVDEQTRTVTAIMRQNQTWVTVRPMVVEGNHPEFGVVVKPDAVANKDPNKALAGLKASFSSKAAHKYMDTVAKTNANKVMANSQKAPNEEAADTKNKVDIVQAGQTSPVAQNTQAMPAANNSQVQPLAAPIMAPPELGQSASLNDVLSAISNAAPPGGGVSQIPAMLPSVNVPVSR